MNKKIRYLIKEFPKSNIQAGEGMPEGEYPFYTSSQELTLRYKKAFYPPNSITMGTGGIACINFSSVPYATSTDCWNFKSISGDTKYLYYWIFSQLNLVDDLYFWGMGLKHLQKEKFKNLVIDFPSDDKVKNVLKFLDKKCLIIDSLVNNLNKQIVDLENLLQSTINEKLFSSSSKRIPISDNFYYKEIPQHYTLMKIGFAFRGTKDGTHSSYGRVISGLPLLSAKNVYNDEIKISDNESLISEADYKEIVSCGYPKKGDVLFTAVGSIGRTCVYNFDKPMAFQRSVLFIRPLKDVVTPEYLSYYMRSYDYKAQYSMYIKTSAQSGLYGMDIYRTYILFPSIEKQKQIVAELNIVNKKIRSLINIKRNKINDFLKYKTSLIYEYVNKQKEVA